MRPRSGSTWLTEDVEAGSRTSHCAGGAATFSGALPGFSHAGLRASCAQPVAVDAMYTAFRSVGLEYGPEYRTLTSARVSRESGIAVGQLRRRSRREGTRVHPADLDGSLHLTALLAEATAASEIRLPFSVGEATLSDVSGRAWPVAEKQGSSTVGVWVGAMAKASPGARLTDFETRVLKAAPAPAPVRKPTHLYVTAWQRQAVAVQATEGTKPALVACASAPPSAGSGSGGTAAALQRRSARWCMPSASQVAADRPTRSPAWWPRLTSLERTPSAAPRRRCGCSLLAPSRLARRATRAPRARRACWASHARLDPRRRSPACRSSTWTSTGVARPSWLRWRGWPASSASPTAAARSLSWPLTARASACRA